MAKSVKLLLRVSPVAVALMQCSGALAQEVEEPEDTGQPNTIIVTAQLREQTLQEVPVAVSVIGGDTLREQQITGIDGLDELVPNLTVTRSPFQPIVSIRGLGSGGGSRAFEQSVAMYVDGIYAGRANQFLNPFFDVQRVEVVRGPQSVLFGVNANAGAINIINTRPGDTLEGYIGAGYEFENEGYNLEAAVSVPITDTFGVRVAGRTNREGGYVFNTVQNRDDGQVDSAIGRIVASWRPTPDLRFDLSYEHGDMEIDGTNLQLNSLGAVTFPPEIEDGVFDFRKSTAGTPEFTDLQTDNASLNIRLDLEGIALSSATGYSAYEFAQFVQGANHPLPVGTAGNDESFEQFYQEFRLYSTGTRFFDYIVGATYYHQDSRIDQGNDIDLTNFGVPGVTGAVRNGLDQETNGYSVFAQGTLNFTDDLNLVVGGRYSIIEKAADYVIAPTTLGQSLVEYTVDVSSLFILSGPPFGFFQWFDPNDPSTFRTTEFSRDRTFRSFNPAVSLNYEIDFSTSVYASFTTGTKAGGYNDQEKSGIVPENGFSDDLFNYSSEDARNFEIGLKYAGRDVRFNVAAFYTEYEDLQVNQPLPSGALLTTNAASATARGVEVDLTWAVTDGLILNADAAYLHARYDDYPGACLIGDVNCIDPVTGNAAGGRLDAVPDFTGSIGASYTTPINNSWELRTRGRFYYNDGAQFGPEQNPFQRSPSYTTIDAAIGVAQIDGGLSFTLTGKNLANNAIRSIIGPSVGAAAFGYFAGTMPGRQIFLDARFEF
ncbi:MAG: TonB-dependent receptor [Novosphingobium sp.]|nr:TonB-dependent receptor [Novosphingobium sp.]